MSSSRDHALRILFFGTYDPERHPRVKVLKEGLAARGADVRECHRPLDLGTAARVRILQRPWLAPLLLARIAVAWIALAVRGLRHRDIDVVVVGYMGHLDIHLARLLWPRTTRVLDHLISLADTATDRGETAHWKTRLLDAVDRAAVQAADVPVVDTDAHVALLPRGAASRAVVVPVGAPNEWFIRRRGADGEVVEVVFFGLFTPLQGTPVIGATIAHLAGEQRLRFTMIGNGQDLAEAQRRAGDAPNAKWIDWMEPDELRQVVARSDVCLGIFGTGQKALRVVPNKVYQGAAAGCAVVTSDTEPQRRALGHAGIYVPAGDAEALAETLHKLATDLSQLEEARRSMLAHARNNFTPRAVVAPLWDVLRERENELDQP